VEHTFSHNLSVGQVGFGKWLVNLIIISGSLACDRMFSF
jgi:hypothetical protein